MNTARDSLNSGDPAAIAKASQAIKAGNQASLVKAVATGLTSGATQDITTAAFKAAATITGITLDDGENLPAIGQLVSLRSTAGAADTAARVATDSAATPAAGAAVISADRKSVTLEGATTALIIEYFPAPDGGADQEVQIGAP